jgi:hypothetical protein
MSRSIILKYQKCIQILFGKLGKPSGKPLGRPRRRWKYDIKTDLK